MIQAHETDHYCKFIAPDWAYKFESDEDMKFKPHDCLNKITKKLTFRFKVSFFIQHTVRFISPKHCFFCNRWAKHRHSF